MEGEVVARLQRILVVEDDPIQAALVRAWMSDWADLRRASTLAEAESMIQHDPPDAVLLDLCLPDSDGPDTYYRLRRAAPDTPIVVCSATADEALMQQLVEGGAHDYLLKEDLQPERLHRAMRFVEARRSRSRRTLAELRRLRKTRWVQHEASERAALRNQVAHEVGTPLTPVVIQVRLLLRQALGPLTPDQERSLGIIQRNIERIQAGLAQCVDVAERGNSASVALDKFLPPYLRRFEHELDAGGIQLVAPPGPNIRCVPTHLEDLLDLVLASALVDVPPNQVAVHLAPSAVGPRMTVEWPGPLRSDWAGAAHLLAQHARVGFDVRTQEASQGGQERVIATLAFDNA